MNTYYIGGLIVFIYLSCGVGLKNYMLVNKDSFGKVPIVIFLWPLLLFGWCYGLPREKDWYE